MYVLKVFLGRPKYARFVSMLSSVFRGAAWGGGGKAQSPLGFGAQPAKDKMATNPVVIRTAAVSSREHRSTLLYTPPLNLP